ncbi:hypothetical protein EV421DRAFT_1997683 [Armillaria borealis]|uniref:Uncharacterized protein n=1 Tax=Armillaria borealis TaxID=47425 RepID=A0AA39J0Q0_9AGAR|nr:hypothetical protein EV421DRAFT_1997683 [Armillaria borealis]
MAFLLSGSGIMIRCLHYPTKSLYSARDTVGVILQQLRCGEDPKLIRTLDFCPPKHLDLLEGREKDVPSIQIVTSDKMAVDAAFSEPWPVIDESLISVFNAAAISGSTNGTLLSSHYPPRSTLKDPRTLSTSCLKDGVEHDIKLLIRGSSSTGLWGRGRRVQVEVVRNGAVDMPISSEWRGEISGRDEMGPQLHTHRQSRAIMGT